MGRKLSSLAKMTIDEFNNAKCPLDDTPLEWVSSETGFFATHCNREYYADFTPDHDYNVNIILSLDE